MLINQIYSICFHFQASLYTFEGCPLLINDNEDKQKHIYII